MSSHSTVKEDEVCILNVERILMQIGLRTLQPKPEEFDYSGGELIQHVSKMRTFY